ncbi:hypothetical protein HBI04_221810 [Parastagonospora nodorum]|nr:hypothetical protein HBI04_221810 [Parastagonospora nodorum]KAH4267741.1 hypothetical protein HBI03_068920 [Parastagonospora nodorum]
MKYAFAQVAFGLSANALVAREAAQCVQLQASGGVSGVFGQLGDGQNRVGGGHSTGCYCLSNGGFTDSNGRGCILTPPTTQFQCDVGAAPSTGFAIGSNGGITSNGSGKFYACPVNDNGEYNVYTEPAPGQEKCVEISLSSAGSCGPAAAAPQPSKPAAQPSQPGYSQKPAPPSEQPVPKPSKPTPQPGYSQKPAPTSEQPAYSDKPVPTPQQPAPQPGYSQKPAPTPEQPIYSEKPAPTTQHPAPQPGYSQKPAPTPEQPAPKPSQPASEPSGSCPTDLNGAYQYPHLIIPVDSTSPDKAAGTSYNGKVNKSTCSIFNFDIPTSYAGKQCTVLFLFPEQKDLETSSYTVSGNGQCSFSKLSGPADQQTSYANQPAKESEVAKMSVAPGNSYVVASGECAAGQRVAYEMCSEGDFALDYFQDYNPSPIGLYVRQC